MIDELYFVFKPLLVTLAAIIIPVVGIFIFFGACAVAIKAVRLFVAAIKNQSWRNVLGNKVNALVDRLGSKTGERFASEIDRLNKAAIAAQKAKYVDYRAQMLGKWYDDIDNTMEILEEGGVYILHFSRCESDRELDDVKLILRAAIMRTTDPNILTTSGIQSLDMAYSGTDDTIFMADFGTTFKRMTPYMEDYFSWREAMENGELDTPHATFSMDDVSAAFANESELEAFTKPTEEEAPVSRNIII